MLILTIAKAFKQKKYIALLAVALLSVVFIPAHQAKAGGVFDFIFGTSSFGALINAIATLILSFLGTAISFFAKLLDGFIQYQTQNGVYNVLVVDQSWTIIRDFVNMFFILVLIIMAFGTIFGIEKYGWKKLLTSFIIAALLINFSLVIGQYIITVSNDLAGVFLKQIQNAGGISTNFAQGAGLGQIITSGSTNLVDGAGNVVVTAIFAIIFLVIIMLTFAATAIFSIVRLFFLWFLLIISPIAWIGYTLPGLKSQMWSQWWKQFLCWCFFLPYFLFFVMFAVMFVQNSAQLPQVQGSMVAAGLTGNSVMLYALSLVFLIGGMAMAKKMACASGTGVRKVFGAIEGGVRKYSARYAPGASYARSLYGGAKQGVAEKGKEIQEKGVFGIGGMQAERLRTAKFAEKFGFGAAKGAEDRAKATEIDKELKKIQSLNLTTSQLNQRISTAKGVEKIAAFKVKSENGWLTPSDLGEINRLMREVGGGRTATGTSILQSLKKGNFEEMAQGPAQKETIFAAIEDVELKKAYGLSMANSREVMTEGLMQEILGLYKGESAENKEKIREALKKNVGNLADGKTTAEKETLLARLGGIDSELQKSFAMELANSGEVRNETVMQNVLDMYKDESLETKKKLEEALKKNVENFAKDKNTRVRIATGHSASGINDARINKIVSQVMVEKKDINDWQSKNLVLELNGGVDPTGEAATVEGRALAKEIEDSNIVFAEEKIYRKNNPTTTRSTADLTSVQKQGLENQILDSIDNRAITGFTTEELDSTLIFNALYNGLNSGRLPSKRFDQLVGLGVRKKGQPKPDRKKRAAAEAIRSATGPIPY